MSHYSRPYGCADLTRWVRAYGTVADFASELDISRKELKISSGPIPIGVGFLGHKLDKAGDSTVREMLEHSLEQKVRAIWLSFGDDLGKWVSFVRDYEAEREHKSFIFIVVGTVSEALRAANEFRADAIVAQGA
jgi:nitronate monooxygenase